MEQKYIRVACCQFAPTPQNVEENMAKAESLMINLNPGDAHLVLLPELAFTGYIFRDRQSIAPFVEDSQTGPTVTWAKKTAARLMAHVVVGYPRVERGGDGAEDRYYNSLCFVAPNGAVLCTYNKHFLYEVDENWAEEGLGFCTVHTEALGKIGIGICMDLNPWRFEAPFDAYEWANFLLKENVEMAVLIAAWRDPNVSSEEALETPNYWANRMTPLFGRPTTLVVCNRTGTEDDVTFAGCSCVMSLKEPMLLAQLNKRQQNVLLVEVETTPRARPELVK